MTSDAKYINLDITNKINANKIDVDFLHVKNLTLEDKHVNTNIGVTSKKIKDLYETNKDTNCLTNDDKSLLCSLHSTMKTDNDSVKFNVSGQFQVTSQGQLFSIPDEIDYKDIPEGHGVWCFNTKYGLIMKFKKNGKCLFTHGNTYEWSLPVEVTVDDSNTVKVGIDTI